MKMIKPCGWIKVSNYDFKDNVPDTICNYNISVDWNDIESVNINNGRSLVFTDFKF